MQPLKPPAASAPCRLPASALLAGLCALLLAACASAPRGGAPWPLSPRELPAPLHLQQQLRIERGGESRQFEALLEADAEAVQLAVLALGQVALRLRWDGERLEEWRAAWLPPQPGGRDVLQDLQFALWPLAALRRAAPQGWRVEEQEGQRTVWQGRALVARIGAGEPGHWRIERPRAGYVLEIRSVAAEGAP
ncbi:DUF3261 domain-containing protein [Silanimonas lenta]|uniref:DUF3261 domain-containing protein n=1 Tax=Silanimonas lenta TaxID=265429 RepID=UPI0004018E46|nr:DUF3261 domain-containing protein [Silanimonas lenta]